MFYFYCFSTYCPIALLAEKVRNSSVNLETGWLIRSGIVVDTSEVCHLFEVLFCVLLPCVFNAFSSSELFASYRFEIWAFPITISVRYVFN